MVAGPPWSGGASVYASWCEVGKRVSRQCGVAVGWSEALLVDVRSGEALSRDAFPFTLVNRACSAESATGELLLLCSAAFGFLTRVQRVLTLLPSSSAPAFRARCSR